MYPILKTYRLLSLSAVRVLPVCAILLVLTANVVPQNRKRALKYPTSGDPVPKILLLRIFRAEDERRWDNDLRSLFSARSAAVRARAALAAGRIGNEDAGADLILLLRRDDESDVRAMAAFALGEIESSLGADALLTALKDSGLSRARAVEALGKIAAALPKEQEARSQELAREILAVLTFEARRRSAPDQSTILFALTAVLRSRPENAGPIVAEFLGYSDPRIRADAANTLARLKLKDGNDQLRKLLRSDPNPIVRANAARVLGTTEDKLSFEALLDRALKDEDSRVRVSSIRALGSLKGAPATVPLIERGDALLRSATRKSTDKAKPRARPTEVNELLEIATALGRLRQDSKDSRTATWLRQIRPVTGPAPEIEIALARIHPDNYLSEIMMPAMESILLDWRAASSIAQGLGEIAAVESMRGNNVLHRALQAMLDYRNSSLRRNTLITVHSEYAIPDVLRAYAAFKPKDLAEVLRKHLKESDVVIRATAAELLGELPLDSINTEALSEALKVALTDRELNDAALAILDALAKQKNRNANLAIQLALDSEDHLIRRKAVASLKATGAGDFSSRLPAHLATVKTRNTTVDYERAIARMGKQVTAVVTTTKGSFTINLLPDEATLNVDNFVQLAKRKYFDGITFHRVVPNFVIQDGDPRGDGNGGPGYQIRCEINEMPYARGAVGMALSGKDTGGSQWFVTHSPQPHLDGGYTVFGNVTAGMDTVDNIVRGDVIRTIVITESARRALRPAGANKKR